MYIIIVLIIYKLAIILLIYTCNKRRGFFIQALVLVYGRDAFNSQAVLSCGVSILHIDINEICGCGYKYSPEAGGGRTVTSRTFRFIYLKTIFKVTSN